MQRDQQSSGAAEFDADAQRHARANPHLHSVSPVSAGDALKASATRYRRMFEAAEDGILMIDALTGVIADANPYLEGLLGYARDEMVGRTVWELDAFQEVIANRLDFLQLQAGQSARRENLRLETRNRDIREVQVSSNQYLVDGRRFMQCNIRDNTGRRQAADELKRLREQATRDVLTGLVNRRFLEESLERELHRSRRAHTSLGLAMLDLDRFKQFNDAFGHAAGDALLTQVGAVLGSAMRKSDIACRYGGEEFVIVFRDTSIDDACRHVEQIRAMIRGLAVRHGNRLLGCITVSAGVATAPDHGGSVRQLLASADDAMYRAKRDGRNRLVCCTVHTASASSALLVIKPSSSGPVHAAGCTSLVLWRDRTRP